MGKVRRVWLATLAVGLVAGGGVAVNAATASAAESSPIGWAVTVSSASALDSALQSSSRQIIRVSGMISLSGMHKVNSNKSILGVGSGSGISGGGLNLSGVSNVIT